MKEILFLVIGYVFGSIPSGVWIGKYFKNIDIREHGSKNTGTTNAYRILGSKYGIMVLLIDALKGFIPLALASHFGVKGIPLIMVGIIAIMGHSLSFFLGFKGGKGVATSLGVYLFLMPKVVLILVGVFAIVSLLSKYISLGSIVCAILLPILTCFLPIRGDIPKMPLVIMNLFVGAFVVYKHSENIKRIIKGEESEFKF